MTELVKTEPNELGALLKTLQEREMPVEVLERLLSLHERIADRTAASEFAEALSRFQSECPPVPQTSAARKGADRNGMGGTVMYTYARLDAIARHCQDYLKAAGLSYRWDSEETTDGRVRATCFLRHVAGHEISASFTCPVEGTSIMSGPQKTASALTYAKRQALVQVLGLTTCEPDNDAAPVQSAATVTEAQAMDLQSAAESAGADVAKFLKWLGAESFSTIRAVDFKRAMGALEAKARQA